MRFIFFAVGSLVYAVLVYRFLQDPESRHSLKVALDFVEGFLPNSVNGLIAKQILDVVEEKLE